MTKLYNQAIMKERRRELRNNMTSEERIVWKMLKKYAPGAKFRRQFSAGPYILDFYSPEHRLCIEIDGQDHLSKFEYDSERDIFLSNKKIRVIRFSNKTIRNDLGIAMQKINEAILFANGN